MGVRNKNTPGWRNVVWDIWQDVPRNSHTINLIIPDIDKCLYLMWPGTLLNQIFAGDSAESQQMFTIYLIVLPPNPPSDPHSSPLPLADNINSEIQGQKKHFTIGIYKTLSFPRPWLQYIKASSNVLLSYISPIVCYNLKVFAIFFNFFKNSHSPYHSLH